jgi:hypothetical protein
MDAQELITFLSKLKRIKTLAEMVGYKSHEAMRILIRKHNVEPITIDREDFYSIDSLPPEIKERIAQGRLRKGKAAPEGGEAQPTHKKKKRKAVRRKPRK